MRFYFADRICLIQSVNFKIITRLVLSRIYVYDNNFNRGWNMFFDKFLRLGVDDDGIRGFWYPAWEVNLPQQFRSPCFSFNNKKCVFEPRIQRAYHMDLHMQVTHICLSRKKNTEKQNRTEEKNHSLLAAGWLYRNMYSVSEIKTSQLLFAFNTISCC